MGMPSQSYEFLVKEDISSVFTYTNPLSLCGQPTASAWSTHCLCMGILIPTVETSQTEIMPLGQICLVNEQEGTPMARALISQYDVHFFHLVPVKLMIFFTKI